MLRQCITFLRTRGFTAFLPLDNHIYLHKVTGILIGAYSLVHTIMHLLNFTTVVVYDPKLNCQHFTVFEWLLTTKPGLFGFCGGCANPTGIALVIVLCIMVICSQPFVRRGGSFEIFYWTHLLYVPFWMLVLLHGPNFWKWFTIPLLIYLAERAFRFISMRTGHGKTYISSGILLPSKVTHLVIKRPPHFYFRPGDYVFVSIPAIAKYEWHPFTLSSAPEQEDYMWLHIRGVGEWTNRLYSYFEKEQARLHSGEIMPANVAEKTKSNLQSSVGGNSFTPQKDFLARNLTQMKTKSKNTSTTSTANSSTAQQTPAMLSNENEIEKKENPFDFSKTAKGSSSRKTSSGSITGHPKLDRQISESKAKIKKIQATLQRTFSRRANTLDEGMANEGFVSDETNESNNVSCLALFC